LERNVLGVDSFLNLVKDLGINAVELWR